MDIITSPIVLGVVVLLITIVLAGLVFSRNYIKIPPNQVGVFTGRGKPKPVVGGARFRMPVLERVDIMSLEPYSVNAKAENVISINGVPVTVTAVGTIGFSSDPELLQTGVENFLTKDRDKLGMEVRDILEGNLRSIVSQMNVEDLNSDRENLRRRVLEEAESDYRPLGMSLKVLAIQNITDSVGYLDALGQTRIAEVKRDAEVGKADAERETMVKAADARRAGQVAEAEAAMAIAQAEEIRDRELAQISARIEAERATASQAGPRAQAQARRAVVLAETEVEREREQAQIGVEQQRALRAEQAQRADVIIPAEAARQAAIVRAEGEREAAIAAAQAEAQSRTLAGDADARARKALADAKREEMVAEAAGEEARLIAQATGQRELAEALNQFTPSAMHLQVLPEIIAAMPEMANAIAAQIGQIGKMVVVSGGGSNGEGGDMMSQLTSAVPAGLAAVIETIRATTGVDVKELVNNGSSMTTEASSATSSGDGEVALVAPSSNGASSPDS